VKGISPRIRHGGGFNRGKKKKEINQTDMDRKRKEALTEGKRTNHLRGGKEPAF